MRQSLNGPCASQVQRLLRVCLPAESDGRMRLLPPPGEESIRDRRGRLLRRGRRLRGSQRVPVLCHVPDYPAGCLFFWPALQASLFIASHTLHRGFACPLTYAASET